MIGLLLVLVEIIHRDFTLVRHGIVSTFVDNLSYGIGDVTFHAHGIDHIVVAGRRHRDGRIVVLLVGDSLVSRSREPIIF